MVSSRTIVLIVLFSVVPRWGACADENDTVSVECRVDDVEYSTGAVLPIRMLIWNGGSQELLQFPGTSWRNEVVEVHFRDNKTGTEWLKLAPPNEDRPSGFAPKQITIMPQRSACYYNVLPLWRLPASLRQVRRLEMRVSIRFKQGRCFATQVPVRMGAEAATRLEPNQRDTIAYLDTLMAWKPSDRFDRELLRPVPNSASTISFKNWLRLICCVQDFALLTRDTEMAEKKLFSELRALPPIAREALGLKLCSELLSSSQVLLADKEASTSSVRRNLEIARELIEPCRLGCLQTVYLNSEIERISHLIAE